MSRKTAEEYSVHVWLLELRNLEPLRGFHDVMTICVHMYLPFL